MKLNKFSNSFMPYWGKDQSFKLFLRLCISNIEWVPHCCWLEVQCSWKTKRNWVKTAYHTQARLFPPSATVLFIWTCAVLTCYALLSLSITFYCSTLSLKPF